MKEQYYYASLPTKLIKENFKSKKDRNQHLLAITIITSWVNTKTGKFYLSVRKLAEELECSIKRAKTIIDNLIKWGYIQKISTAPNQYGQSVYKLLTYNWNEKMETAKETALETATNQEYQRLKQNQETALETAKETQTNNNKTNNEKTNNEKKEEIEKEKDLERIKELWNKSVDQKIIGLTKERKKRLRECEKILRENGLTWEDAINQFNQSPFIHKFGFDWFIKSDNFIKTLEGRYRKFEKSETKEKQETQTQEQTVLIEYDRQLLKSLTTLKQASWDPEYNQFMSILSNRFEKATDEKVFIKATKQEHRLINEFIKDYKGFLNERVAA